MLIGISGGSGSGKTSFIKDLKASFTEKEICFLSQDDYYIPREDQKIDENGIRNFDLPESIDQESFVEDILRIKNGEQIQRKEYVFNNELAVPKMLTFSPAPIIIVEGLFVFSYKRLWDLLELKILIDTKENIKVIRRIKRDGIERNYPLDDVLYRYEHHVLPSYEKHIQPFKNEVDLVINNNDNYNNGLAVVVAFLKSQLKV